MYPFIEGEYICKENILMVEQVPIEMLSYPEEGYNNLFEIEEDSFWFQYRNRCIANVIQTYPSKRLVDVGGGNGCVTWYLQEKGYDVTLLEPSIQGCLNARHRGVKKIICGLLQEKNIKPGSIEALCLFDVLEHIEDDQAFLETLHSRMQTNGRIYLTVPAFKKLWSKEDKEAGHFKRYEQDELTKLLEKTGFRVEYSNYFFGFLYLPIRLVRGLGGSIRSNQVKSSKQKGILSKEHKSYYKKVKRLVDYLMKKEMQKMMTRPIKRGSSLIVVAKVN